MKSEIDLNWKYVDTYIESIHNTLDNLIRARVSHSKTCLPQQTNTALSRAREEDEGVCLPSDCPACQR